MNGRLNSSEDIQGNKAIIDLVLCSDEIEAMAPEKICEYSRKMVEENVSRIRKLGGWPDWVLNESLSDRIPKDPLKKVGGFDAGIACALNMIPKDKQKLSSILHAAYTIDAVKQVQSECDIGLDPNCETCWWLAACSVCLEGEVTPDVFKRQLMEFIGLRKDKKRRLEKSQEVFDKMVNSFSLDKFGPDVPFGTEDGCIQGAYIAGYKFGVFYHQEQDSYYVGTYFPSLGIPDDFEWSNKKNRFGEVISGPVFGSKQFVRCSSEQELKLVIEKTKNTLRN